VITTSVCDAGTLHSYDGRGSEVTVSIIERTQNVFVGRVLTLNIESVRLPNGHVADLEIAHHPGGAAVVAIDAEGRVCLLRQYRHAAGGWLTELPAGKLDGGEPPLQCAQRELAEEAGMEATRWTGLGRFYTSPGVLTEQIHLYLAEDLRPVAAQPEAHEVLTVDWLPFASALEQARSGLLDDGKTIVGLVRAAERRKG
jgi:ADP-ribose pyrophosphatase